MHKGERYPGEHEPIIDLATWNAAQEQLNSNAVVRRSGVNARSPSLLSGLLVDENGTRLRPSHANNHGHRYRYYVSASCDDAPSNAQTMWRLPASEIEAVVVSGIANFLEDRVRLSACLGANANIIEAMLSRASELARHIKESTGPEQRQLVVRWVRQVVIGRDRVNLELRMGALKEVFLNVTEPDTTNHAATSEAMIAIELSVAFKRRGIETKIVLSDTIETGNCPDANLIEAITLGHEWFAKIKAGDLNLVSQLARRYKVNQGDVSRVMRLGLLAPDIVEAILDGRQPVGLTAAKLKRIGELPIRWQAQRQVLGFA